MNVSTVTAEAASEVAATVVNPSIAPKGAIRKAVDPAVAAALAQLRAENDAKPADDPSRLSGTEMRRLAKQRAAAAAVVEPEPTATMSEAEFADLRAFVNGDAPSELFEGQPVGEPDQDAVDAALAALNEGEPLRVSLTPEGEQALADADAGAEEAGSAQEGEPVVFAPGMLALDASGVAEGSHWLIKVMSREVKAACTVMFRPAPADASEGEPSCSDCYLMKQKAIGAGDPDDPSVIAAALDVLRAGQIAIPSVTDNGAESRDAFREVVPVANRPTLLARPAPPAFDFTAALRAVLFYEDVLKVHVDELRRLFEAGDIVLRSSVPAVAARAVREPREPRAARSQPAAAATAGAGRGTRSIQPKDVPGADGKNLKKLWWAEAHGPYLAGNNSDSWIARDTRTNTDHVFAGRKAGKPLAFAFAQAEAAKLPQAEREAFEATLKAERMVWDETRFVAR